MRLTIIPADEPNVRRVVTLIRDEIKLEDQEAKAELILIPDGHGRTNRLGILDLPSFYATMDLPGDNGDLYQKSTTTDVRSLIEKLELEKVSGIISTWEQWRRFIGRGRSLHRLVRHERAGRAGAFRTAG